MGNRKIRSITVAREAGQFKKGNPGKPKGTVNKLTATVKETVHKVFNELQADPKHDLKAFAKDNLKEFYQIAAKLIPTEVSGGLKITDKVIFPGDEPND